MLTWSVKGVTSRKAERSGKSPEARMITTELVARRQKSRGRFSVRLAMNG